MVDDERRVVGKPVDLPKTDFRLTGIDLYGTIIEPKDLVHLEGLSSLRELYLPGPSWNPGAGSKLDENGSFKHLAGLKNLTRLEFSLHFLSYFNITDVAFENIAELTQLTELRCAQCHPDLVRPRDRRA